MKEREGTASAAGARPDLAALEREILANHPEVIAAIDADDVSGVARPSALRNIGSVVAVAVIVLAPLLGVAIYGEHPYLSSVPKTPASTSVPVAGVCFAVVVLAQLVIAATWIRGGALWSVPVLLYGLWSGALALLSAIGTANVARDAGYDPAGWRTPIIAAAVCGGALVLAVLARIGARARIPARVTGWQRVRRTVGALPKHERDALRARRNTALRELADRGAITEARRVSASGAALGELRRMEQVWRRLDGLDADG
ncbi:hypothetical protein [Leifsonia sp. TF02-11]|uniref:hypothetical protein n=1 Tax=Leifsonia sp. TF02-11 TaxID=2815212 RepID=UPI001AA1C902|nr:hypothetical protein [Leifsonia sp. TF02-11]MBO1741458.1 hypothetical protein [Leifsonia sp. TF02-11]